MGKSKKSKKNKKAKKTVVRTDFFYDFVDSGGDAGLREGEIDDIIAGLAATPGMRSVDLGGVPLSVEDLGLVVDTVLEYISHPLEVLNLSKTGLADAGLQHLARIAPMCTVLDLSLNTITAAGLCAWMKALPSHSALRTVSHIDLSENRIADGAVLADFIAFSGVGGATLAGMGFDIILKKKNSSCGQRQPSQRALAL